jgi:ketosteroid isomerase-like protein
MRQFRCRVVFVVVLMAVNAWATVGFAQSSAQDTIQAEIRAAWEEYARAFSAQRADVIADRFYLSPSFNLAPTGVVVLMTTADVKARFETWMAALAAQNYQRSETKFANICVLNDTAAILSAQFIRYRKDGTVLSEPAGTYVFAKTEAGWRIVAQMGHTPDRVLKCGS